jgi:Tol biopolymer transport system component
MSDPSSRFQARRLIAFPLLLVMSLALACNVPTWFQPSATALPGEATPGAAGETPPAAAPLVTRVANSPVPDSSNLDIVYTKENNLWFWSGGKALQLTTSGDAYNPRLSTDGQWIAFMRPVSDFNIELWAIQRDGSGERRLVSVDDLNAIGSSVRNSSAVAINPYQYDWVPGKHTLAFNTQQVFQGPGLSLLNDLNLVDADSGQLSVLFQPGWGGDFFYSPDGSQVAISRPETIVLSNADGSELRTVLNYTLVTTYSEYRYYATPSWSPDGAFLRVAIPPVEPLAEPRQPTALYRLPVDGSAAIQEGSLDVVPFFEMQPTYSPDLSRLAFLRETGQPAENRRELLLSTYDGKGEWVYARAPLLRFGDWSPDNRRFVYLSGDNQEAWLGSLDETPQPLTSAAAGISRLRWVDADRLVYVQQSGETYDLYLLDLKSGLLLLDSTGSAPPVYDF